MGAHFFVVTFRSSQERLAHTNRELLKELKGVSQALPAAGIKK